MRHTPGPWIACEYGDYTDYDGNCRLILGEGGDIRTAVVLGFDTTENRANARLIAAAPELLETLAALMNDARLVRDGIMAASALTLRIDEASAAIAKATGDTQ